MSHISLDFETFYSKKRGLSIKSMIAEQYCAHPDFYAYMLSVSDGESTWAGEPRHFNWDCLAGQDVTIHNSYFDTAVWKEMHKRGVAPAPNYRRAICTANLTSYICNRRALDMAVEHLYGVRLDKTMRGEASDKHWPKDFPAAERAAMLEYARRDAVWCWKLFSDYGPKWPAVEQRLSDITIRQGQRGVQINVELLNNYICWSHEAKTATENLIPWIKDADDDSWEDFPAKPTSTKCIAEQCRRVGIPCAPVKNDDEEAYAEWEAAYAPKHPWIQALTAWRSINKLYRTFLVMKDRLRPDGTMPFSLLYFGAHTGRWAASARVNMQNQRRRPVVIRSDNLLELDDRRVDTAMKEYKETNKWPSWVRYTIDFRHLIIPRPGKKMIVSDLSQIEPRVLAWLVGNKELLEMLKTGMSIYEAHARASMNWRGGKLKDEDPGLYALAKARVLALGYQAGWEKFIVMAYDLAGLDITVGDPEQETIINPVTGMPEQIPGYGFNARRVVREFRAENPKIVGLWKKLDGGFKGSVGDDFSITLPNGREMKYNRVRGETRFEQDKDGKPIRKSMFTADADGRRKPYYGGKLTENTVQAIARDVFGEHMVRMDDAGLDQLFSVHDEDILEVDKNVSARDVEAHMSFCPEWLEGCPIGAEAKEVEHYQK